MGRLLLKRSIMVENGVTVPRGTFTEINPDFASFTNRSHPFICSDFRTGSIERLVDGDKRVIATKHLLPENNINVVVR